MIRLRQQAGQYPLSLPVLITITIISSLFLVELIHAQPNYYFKASAPAVKSLPRIGRRSDGESGGRGGGEPPATIPLLRTLESPAGLVEMWQNNNLGNNGGGRTMMDSYPGNSLIAPTLGNQLNKALFWRRLFGDGNNDYGDTFLDSLYRSKS